MKNTHNKSHVPPSQLPILYVFPITRISKVRLSQSFAYIWYQETNSLGLIRLPSCNFKMEAMLWKVAHEGMKFNLWTTSQTLPLFYLRRLEFLISFKGTFEFDLNINVTFSGKLEFVCENWNFFFEIRAYLLLNIGVFGSFFFKSEFIVENQSFTKTFVQGGCANFSVTLADLESNYKTLNNRHFYFT